jgi:pSer/pThr/pTyr-binding forkhead associated (FHA) protein
MVMCLAMATADGGERLFRLSRERMIVGRDTRCDLRVAIPSVAERHCEIVVEEANVRVIDLGSDGGTLRNGEPVQEAVLRPDDELTIGPVTFVVRLEPR